MCDTDMFLPNNETKDIYIYISYIYIYIFIYIYHISLSMQYILCEDKCVSLNTAEELFQNCTSNHGRCKIRCGKKEKNNYDL